MTKIQFCNLCRDASYLLELDDVDALGAEQYVDIDGVSIAVSYDDEDDSGEFLCFVDLGGIDEQRRAEVHTTLLHMNLELDPAQQGSIGIDPKSGHAILSVAIPLEACESPNDLSSLLECYADYALDVRSTVIDANSDHALRQFA